MGKIQRSSFADERKKEWEKWQNENPANSKSVIILEAFIDFLSALTYKNKIVFDLPALVLNSSNMSKKAISFIKDFGFENIYYFGDNDEAGDLALEVFRENLEGVEITDSRGLYKGFKDFNEFLVGDRR